MGKSRAATKSGEKRLAAATTDMDDGMQAMAEVYLELDLDLSFVSWQQRLRDCTGPLQKLFRDPQGV